VNIEGSTILVTGGCGLVGSTTIDLLLRDHEPHKIVAIDDLSRGTLENVAKALEDPRVELMRGDIRDVDTVRRVTEGMDAVIHMATLRITACAEDLLAALEVVSDGSFNVLEVAKGPGLKKVGSPTFRSPDLSESVLIPSMAQYQALSLCVPCVTPMKCVLWGHGKNGVPHVSH
jgi:NAD(P)-dependent dehydrogenase (short-subunit alcohol dehydrogenase family)